MFLNFRIAQLKKDPNIQEKLFSMLNFPVSMAKQYVIATILRYLSNYYDELQVVAEDRYVDKVYRNSFSNYYSTKLNQYPEYCVRLSFLESDVNLSIKEDIINKYLGFMILRPISRGIVGRTAINPKAVICGSDMMVCLAKIRASVLGYKTYVDAFPHSSQDTEYSTCAETSIWSLMEYFGNKYSEYTPILPSRIHDILDNKALERHIPSHGMSYLDISYVLKKCGFGTKIYNRKSHKNDEEGLDFKKTFSTYIESGIPVGVAIQSFSGTPFGHAVVCVGRNKIDRKEILNARVCEANGKKFRRWSDVPSSFIFNDDNVGIYQSVSFSYPAPQHNRYDLFISSIIVPLYKRIYLDANCAVDSSERICTRYLSLNDKTVFRTFLASGNSYMNHLISDNLLSDACKGILIDIVRLPKFVWVTEIADEDKFTSNKVDGILILDATEPCDSIYPLFLAHDKNVFFYDYETKTYRKNPLQEPFQGESFNNLQLQA